MMQIRLTVLASLAGVFLAMPALAQDRMESRLKAVQGSAEVRAATLASGKRAAGFCENCHGENGVSEHAHIPNLAAQNPLYLLTQIEKFADGRRQDEFMSGLIKVIPPDERFDLAFHYANLPDPTPMKAGAQATRGAQVYQRTCQGCHGAEGHGNRQIPRLAGQQALYITQALGNYRGKDATRKDPAMASVAKRLSEADIQAVAAYVGTLP